METAIFKLDDSSTPGLAKVELLKQKPAIMGRRIFKVRVLEVVKPSTMRRCKVGQTLDVAESHLEFRS